MAKPKVIVQLYPMIPTDGEEDRKARAPVGADSDAYYKAVHEWTDIVKAADEMGIWGMSTIEHHLHSEGYEVGPNPGVLNAHWAAHTKNMHVGALGYVLATQDPIRVAEETAIIDHLTHGKYFVGFARGYQKRWTDILGQASDAPASTSDGSAADILNRQIFEERLEMIIDCWTKDSVELNGQFYQAPYPIKTGVQGYPGGDIARAAGAEGEVDDAGNIRRICVVPKPFQKPHPPVFIGVHKSPETIEYCAKHGFHPCYFNPTDVVIDLARMYLDEANKAGHNFQLGERQNIVRQTRIAPNRDEFKRRVMKYDIDIFKNFYSAFASHNVERADPSDEAAFDAMQNTSFLTGGTVDDAIAYWRGIFDQAPFEYITLIWHFAQQPKDLVLEEMQLFMDKVLPELDVPDYAVAAE
ncbi:MAG: LLM class flavin-dependent oxidoreductase [Proteobacteria bacterium]|nr:LLM class flavin-dependent oxidoreductase [Pseudomonadota bacterium]